MLASNHIIKQIIPATPGWYMIFKDSGSTKHKGKLIPAWGVVEKYDTRDEVFYTSIEPLHPDGSTGNLDTWADCSDFVTVVFRPLWFKQSTSDLIEISNFDPSRTYSVTDG